MNFRQKIRLQRQRGVEFEFVDFVVFDFDAPGWTGVKINSQGHRRGQWSVLFSQAGICFA